jgi:hypothetical protein
MSRHVVLVGAVIASLNVISCSGAILTGFLPDVLKSILVEKTREAAKCYRHQSLIASTVVAGSAFTLGSSRLSQS